MSTHLVRVDRNRLIKTYTSWDRDEHRREWTVLTLVDRFAPGLGPQPLAADLDARPPTVTMSVVPGRPLDPTAPDQLDGWADALRRLWAVPPPPVPWRDDLAYARGLLDTPWPGAEGDVAAALAAAAAWWDGPDPDRLRAPPPVVVLGHRDPNPTNYLWDGRTVRIVDFEDAAPSDPATELALLIEHRGAERLDGDGFRTRFDVDDRRFRAARRVWAMFWLHLLRPGGPAVARNPPGTTDRQARRVLELL